MNSDYDTRLEAEISRELKDLPPLRAPDSLVPRVLAALERRSVAPSYRRSWQMWPASLQWASLLVLLILFGGLCFAGWKLSQMEAVTVSMQRVGNWFSGFSAIGGTLSVLWSSAVLILKHLGAGFMIACLTALGLGYAVCLGLGTIYVRIALAASAPFERTPNRSRSWQP
jgi:hypothetical protein